MLRLALSHAQVQSAFVADLTPDVVVPLVVTGMISISVVMIVFIALADTDSRDRADTLRAFADVVRALGDAIRKVVLAVFGGVWGRI